MASSVIDTAKLFDLAVVSVNLDVTLWAEASGCEINWDKGSPEISGVPEDPDLDSIKESPRVLALTEVIDRVKGALPKKQLACAIPGPATLCKLLGLSNKEPSAMDQFLVSELITEYVTILCEAKIDNIIINEDNSVNDTDLSVWVNDHQYRRISKLANHYSITTTLLSSTASLCDAQLEEFNELTFVIGKPDRTVEAAFPNAIKGIIINNFGTGTADLPDNISKLESGTYFLTTAGDLPSGTDLSDIKRDIATVSSHWSS
tara:strand:+ start:1459 stop:2241 length:783 start_codon:yes stop_codon:yes gene_type:complete